MSTFGIVGMGLEELYSLTRICLDAAGDGYPGDDSKTQRGGSD